MKNIILIIFYFLQSFIVFAHQDTSIKLEKDGGLKGLPKKYDSASFNRFTFTLKIGKNSITIPDCVIGNFKNSTKYDISFSASWYHDPELLPHYIHLDIITEESPLGYQIFFNLETLEIFQISKPKIILKENQPSQYFFNEIEIVEDCKIEIFKFNC